MQRQVSFKMRSTAAKKKAIYFIHGLGGRGDKTWQVLTALLNTDSMIANDCDFFAYTYPTALFRFPFTKRSVRLQDLALGLKTELEVRLRDYEEISIVGHSLGGLIARKYLVEEIKKQNHIKVKRLLLFAEPVLGSQLANIAKYFSWRHRHLAQLCTDSDIIETINSDWEILSLPSKLDVVYVLGGNDSAVDRSSVINSVHRSYLEFIPAEGHTSMIRPASSDATHYRITRDFLLGDVKRFPRLKSNLTLAENLPDPLFDFYTPAVEKFYVERREDRFIAAYLQSISLWISGETGLGKTCSIMRALHLTQKKFRYISLGNYAGSNVNGLFQALSETLSDDCSYRPISESEFTWPLIYSQIRDGCINLRTQGYEFIMIEEIPLREKPDFNEFIERFVTLLLFCADQPTGIEFVLSSLNVPDLTEIPQKGRLAEQMKFVTFPRWRESDLRRLVNVILSHSRSPIDEQQIQQLLAASGRSPRFVKVFFREYRQLLSLGGPISVSAVIEHTQNEVG